ncbi:hypothetical protein G0P98_26015, partial [Yangia sp. PrR004]|nr:hypothetical protein [Salipiger sp. PrR004]
QLHAYGFGEGLAAVVGAAVDIDYAGDFALDGGKAGLKALTFVSANHYRNNIMPVEHRARHTPEITASFSSSIAAAIWRRAHRRATASRFDAQAPAFTGNE